MPKIFEYSTVGVRPENRLQFWHEGSKSIGGLQHQSGNRTEFSGSVKLSVLDRLKIGRFVVSANEARWTREMIRKLDDPFLRLIYQYSGTVEIEQGERRFTLNPGNWTLLNADRVHAIRSSDVVEELVMVIPRSVLPASLFDATGVLAQAHADDTPISNLVFDFARRVLDDIPDHSPLQDQFLEGAGTDLLKALLHERLGERVFSTCKDLRMARIRAYIERNLSDPELSVATIASAMGCSKRYVHAIFEGEASVHTLIWEGRLERCRRDLERPDQIGKSITTIALNHGFSCPAHFSRMFKAQYGKPPRQFRLQALES